MPNEQFTNVIRFGPFELDRRSGELSSGGSKIPLQEQPFQILVLLTDRPGEVVTREEIRSRLWPDDTIVEFENAVNAAIKKLRISLGDSADEPQYVETLRRRGYRLMVPVSGAVLAETQRSMDSRADPNVNRAWDRVPESDTLGIFEWKRGWKAIAAAGVLLALVLVASYRYWGGAIHATPRLTDRDKIVLADFINKTDDPVFSDTLRQGLTVQLDQSPFLSLVDEERIQQTLRLMGQPANAPLTPSIALEVCQRTGTTAVLDGSIARLGSQYVLWLRATNCQTGAIIDEEQMQAQRKEDVLGILSQIASRFRARAGESMAMEGKLDVPLAEATTSSLEALKAYSVAWKALSSSGSAAAVPLFKRSSEIDPQFAMAYAMLGRMYGDIGESSLSAENTARAWEMRSHTNERERFFIDASYAITVIGNLEKAQQTCEAWERTYPRDPLVHGFLAGMVYPVFGRYDRVVEQSEKMLQLDPEFPLPYLLLASGYIPLGRLNEAAQTLQHAAERHLQIPDFLGIQYQIAFLRDDPAGMEKIATQAQTDSGAEVAIAGQESFSAAYSGHLEDARRRSELAIHLADQAGQRERAALFRSGAAVREGLFGNTIAAKQNAAAALAFSRGRDVEYGAAFAMALAGDSSAVQTIADDLERRLPEDTSVKFSYLPVLRAQLALNRHNPGKALEWLQLARSNELGEPQSSFFGFYGVLYPVYVRGEAYLALHQGSQAAVEFEKIASQRNIVVNDPIGVLMHLELGRAYAMAGDQAKARAAYSNFLNVWKNADAAIPVLRQARSEYEQLQ